MMDVLRPFRALLGKSKEEAERQLREQAEATRRLQQTIAQYRALLADPRYALIQEDAQQILKDAVTRLIAKALTCAACAGYAERVKLLTDVVLLPPQLVAYERETQAATRAGANGDVEVMELVDE